MAKRKLEHTVSLSPTEIANIERVIESSSLTEVHVEQSGKRIVIGNAAPEQTSEHRRTITVTAPTVGTIYLDATTVGHHVAQGDRLARFKVLETETPITAAAPGRVAAIFVSDGELAAYGADLFLIELEETR